MELRAFAEQVLFATTLEGKLTCPDVLTDENPGPTLLTPPTPGRPANLGFKSTGGAKSNFPNVAALEEAPTRARLLHFFANHELLATELMAFALLRFPDAPSAFRRGLVRTLHDEQEHTRSYIERMRALGLDFGDLPVSGYFWRAVSGMEHPIDYVAGLCLTFEQANLDYCRHFAADFGRVGDTETSGLLDRIYHDEIGHVAYGLKWFRRWKNPSESDWDAFCRQLKFPLSPQRAKGVSFNTEGRRAAGLDPAFIGELEVYSCSRGRTPTVLVFNPFAEAHIACGTAFLPTKSQRRLAADLACLPQFFARQDDVVLVPRRPRTSFLSGLQRAGFPLPEFVEMSESRDGSDKPGSSAALTALSQRKLGRLRPWAWAPDSLDLLGPLFASLTEDPRPPGKCFHPGIGALYSKSWSADFLRRCFASWPEADVRGMLCPEADIGVTVVTVDEACAAIAACRRRGHSRLVLKQPLGLAGANALRLWEPELRDAQRRWMARTLERNGAIVVEPWLEREVDFSVQLEMEPNGLRLCGYTGLINDHRGQFRANWAEPEYRRRLPAQVTRLLGRFADIRGRLRRLYQSVFERLEGELRAVGFLGPLGIDAFVYRTSDGERRLKPIVEINPRHTMGRLTLELMKRVSPGSHGLFRLVARADLGREGDTDFTTYARRKAALAPLHVEGEPVPRIREGWLALIDPDRSDVCLATFQVSRTSEPAEDLSLKTASPGRETAGGSQNQSPHPAGENE